MSNATIDRLEAVTAQLEKLAAALASGAKVGGGGGNAVELAPSAEGWNNYYSDFVQPFIDCSKKLGFNDIARMTEKAWKNVGDLMIVAPNSKKPSQGDLTKFVKPAVEGVQEAGSRSRDPQDKGFSELIQGLSWIMNPKPMPAIQGQLEAADFWLTKVLTTNKDAPNKQDYRDWVAKAKEMMNEMKNYVKEFHRTGVVYGGQGSIFDKPAGAAGGAPAPPAGGPPAPVPPPAASSAPAPKASSGGGGGFGAVLADINKGSKITSGLKKVTADMKTKNRKDRTGVVAAAPTKAAGASKWSEKAQADKPASCRQERGNWIIEYQKDPMSPLTVEGDKYNKDQMKRGVFIYKCGESHIVMPDGKVKNIVIDSCKKTKVYIQGVVSTIEVINCQSVTVVLQKEQYKPLNAESEKEAKVEPETLSRSIAVDKTNGCQILCDEESKKCLELISSMISEVNIQVPGATDKDDPVEMAVAEQFKTVVKYPEVNGKPDYTKKPELVTESVKHG